MSATGRSDVRHPDDFYATPAWCTRAIAPHLRLFPERGAYDPCAGSGAILDVMLDLGCTTSGLELDAERARQAQLRGHGVHSRDALGEYPWRVPERGLVVTNPPYGLALEFVRRALGECSHVAMLLRLPWLASQKRAAWMRANTPAVYVLPRRPSFTGKGTDATDYAWMLWSFGPPTVHILEVSDPTPSGAKQMAQAAPRTP